MCEETALVGVHRNVAVQPIAAPVAHAGIAHSGLTHAGLALPTLTAGLAHPVAGVAAAHGLPAPILPTGIHKREAEAEAEPEADAHLLAAPHHGAAIAPAPRCHAVVNRACKKVPVQTPRVVPQTQCHQRPVPKCATITRTVTDTVCNAVPKEVCHQVRLPNISQDIEGIEFAIIFTTNYRMISQEARQVPVAVPKEVCSQVARQVPVSVPKEVCNDVPRQVCKSVPKQVCHSVPHKVARKVCKNAVAHSYSHQTHGYGHGRGHGW